MWSVGGLPSILGGKFIYSPILRIVISGSVPLLEFGMGTERITE